MTINRLVTLLGVLFCGLGVVFFIPRETKMQPCRVKMELPQMIGGWFGRPAEVTVAERSGLAPDTQFCRKHYDDGLGDEIFVSIVLSGNELDQSIHRPERCLPAQGWGLVDSKRLILPVPAAPNGQLPVTRLHVMRQFTRDGHIYTMFNYNYYWFIGYTDITASHFQREYLDIKDRLLYGYNQRWAYVTVTSTITKSLTPNGRDDEQTAAMLEKMIQDIYPQIVQKEVPGSTPVGS